MATATQIAAEKPVAMKSVVRKHHLLVRLSHWLNIPILLGLGVTGLSIYWAAPIYHHREVVVSANDSYTDYFISIGRWAAYHIPFQHHAKESLNDNWFYNHFSLGTAQLATALRLHWWLVYLFMLNGVIYVVGLLAGGGYRSLVPRKSDVRETFAMIGYYLTLLPKKLLRRPTNHPVIKSKYNALQRSAYLSMPIAGLLAVASGWAIHKPDQLGWLQAMFGGYDMARIWHFWLMWFFAAFVIPHVVLVIADGWDTVRSMVVGWSDRAGGEANE